MKKNLFLVVVLLVLVPSVNAQIRYDSAIRFGVGAMVGIPMADASNLYNLAYGGSISGEYTLLPALGMTLEGDYTAFTKKIDVTLNKKYITGLAGLKYYFSDNMYGGLQAGLSLLNSTGTSTTYIVVPGLGFNVTRNIDFSLRYQFQTEKGYHYSFLALRAGYTF